MSPLTFNFILELIMCENSDGILDLMFLIFDSLKYKKYKKRNIKKEIIYLYIFLNLIISRCRKF